MMVSVQQESANRPSGYRNRDHVSCKIRTTAPSEEGPPTPPRPRTWMLITNLREAAPRFDNYVGLSMNRGLR